MREFSFSDEVQVSRVDLTHPENGYRVVKRFQSCDENLVDLISDNKLTMADKNTGDLTLFKFGNCTKISYFQVMQK